MKQIVQLVSKKKICQLEEVKKTLLVEKLENFYLVLRPPNATDAMEFARPTSIFTTPLSAIQFM